MDNASYTSEEVVSENNVPQIENIDSNLNQEKEISPPENPENLQHVENSIDGAARPPRPIVLPMPENLTETIKTLADECDSTFHVKTAGEWLKIFPETLSIKAKIVSYLQSKKQQFYIMSDSIPPLKFVIRGLHRSCKIADIEDSLTKEGFQILKIVQMISRKDKRVLPLFLIHLP